MSVKGTLVEAKMCTSTLEFTHFIFKKCAIYTHDGERVPNLDSHEADYSVFNGMDRCLGEEQMGHGEEHGDEPAEGADGGHAALVRHR